MDWWELISRGGLLALALLVVGIWRLLHWLDRRELEDAQRALEAEDERRYALERGWVETGEWPLTHYDVYPTDLELTRDLARLKSMGYKIEWQEHTDDGVAVTYSLANAYRRDRKVRDA